MPTLTGAYAVDALTGDERAEFERHLAMCADCTAEVRSLQETAARLGAASAASPPDRLKQRVLAEIRETRQQPPQTPADDAGSGVVDLDRARRRRSWGTRLAAAAAVVGIALAGAFGAVALHTQSELDDARRQLAEGSQRGGEIAEVFGAPDARIVNAGGPDVSATSVLSAEQGKTVFMGEAAQSPPPDRAYQLWFIGDYGYVSAGVMTESADGTMRPVVAGVPPGTQAMGVTDEPAGGSPQPTTDPVLEMPLPA
nr:anti-sigma factor [Saccharopolyspora sp. HNM0983]